jgi:hypothetical protein
MAKIANPYMYNEYKKLIKGLLVEINKESSVLIRYREVISKSVLGWLNKYQELIYDVTCLEELTIIKIEDIKTRKFKYSKYSVKYSGKDEQVIKVKDHVNSYILKLINVTGDLINLNERKEVLINCHLTLHAYSKILTQINREASHNMLRSGYRYKLGNQLGELYPIMFDSSKNKHIKRRIDWIESMKCLEDIANNDVDSAKLLQQYKNKRITKQQFINRMKPYTYTTDKPDKPKWLVSRLDEDKPFIHWSRYKCIVRNSRYYGFVPTNFVHNETRRQSDFIKSVKNKEEIITTPLLGLRDKLFGILKFDSSHVQYFN